MKFKNVDKDTFIKQISNKKVFLFGAGVNMEVCIKNYLYNKNIEAIVDNNENCHEEKGYEVIRVDEFINRIKKIGVSNAILLITTSCYFTEIYEQLNKYKELDELICYAYSFIRDYKTNFSQFEFTAGKQRIPKRINYIWFGNKKMPERLKKYIYSWEKYCPDYEIIEWNEKNYNINKNKYMLQAYENKKWAFVSDVARLDIIYNNGGIYLDTDIEIIKSLDCLLNDEAFFSFCGDGSVNTGSGFGAIKGHSIVKEMLDCYVDADFINENGKMDMTPCQYYQNPIIKKYGFSLVDSYQKKNGIVLYPSEVMSPLGNGMANQFTSKTLAIHYGESSWRSENERKNLERTREFANKIIWNRRT